MKQVLVLTLAVLMLGCSSDRKPATNSTGGTAQGSYLPGSIGQIGEVVIVMNEAEWEGDIGQSFRDLFYEPYVLLPQPESQFKVTWQPEEFFYKFYKSHHNILWVDISDNLNNLDSRITVQEDRFAKDQKIFTVIAKNVAELQTLLESKGDRLVEMLTNNALDRVKNQVYIDASPVLRDSLKKELGVSMDIPRNFQLVADRPGFKWFRSRKTPSNPQLDQGIFVYWYDYTEDSTFTRSFLLNQRDSILRQHVPGVTENSFMGTQYFYEPYFSEINRNGQYAAQIKGLWVIEEDFRGGPFVSMTALDEANNRVITTEAYVYAPHEEKREHMRFMEGILLTTKIGD